MTDALVCVGELVGAHGVRGVVRLRSYTAEPEAITDYGPLLDAKGLRQFKVTLLSRQGEVWLARVEGVEDRTAAEKLRGVRLHVPRAALPEPDDEEYYYADLMGLRAETTDGAALGQVLAVHDFGAGTMLEVQLVGGRTVMVPFTKAVVPVVSIKEGRVVVEPPEGLLAPDAGAPPPESAHESENEAPEPQ